MSDSLRPRDAKGVQEAVHWALSAGKTLEIVGGGSKRAVGRPVQTDLTLDLGAIRGITLYEPQELVLSAKAATALAEIEAAVAAHGQQLAFEPMDCAAILGGVAGRATMGGTLAANLSGPRRVKAGAARDHFLGFNAVSGRGEAFKSGGRVVKNVTGYDLCKLMAGSWGTLAALTDVTIKTLPRPETEETVLVRGLSPAAAIAAMTSAMMSDCDVSAAAHLSEAVAARIPAPEIAGAAAAVTALRLEGFAPSVADRRRSLESLLRPSGEVATAGASSSQRLWKSVRDVTPFAAATVGTERPLWRLSTAASRAAEMATRIAEQAQVEALLDWAGGLLWVMFESCEDAGAAVVARAVAVFGGHATLMRAPASVRAALDVFARQEPALAALTKRIKDGFDPKGVLNPGRMWAGI
jgi:glycolate oxidase FAD binding subunit